MTSVLQPNAESPIEERELEAFAAWRRKEFGKSAALLLETYGGELRSYLVARFKRNESVADDVFSDFLEDFWAGLSDFQWRCSARGWCYVLLRNATTRYHRAPHNRPERRVPLSGLLDGGEVVDRARTQTLEYEKTAVKDRFQELREQLPADDQDLLILRVNRKLPWREVALVMLGPDGDHEDEELVRRKAQALRRRLVETTRRLRKLAEDLGLLDSPD